MLHGIYYMVDVSWYMWSTVCGIDLLVYVIWYIRIHRIKAYQAPTFWLQGPRRRTGVPETMAGSMLMFVWPFGSLNGTSWLLGLVFGLLRDRFGVISGFRACARSGLL